MRFAAIKGGICIPCDCGCKRWANVVIDGNGWYCWTGARNVLDGERSQLIALEMEPPI